MLETKTFEKCLEDNNYKLETQSQELTDMLTEIRKFPNFVYDNITYSLEELVINKYRYREIGSETEQLFLYRFTNKCRETIVKYEPKVSMWLENFKQLFKFTVELKYQENNNFASGSQNTYYINPIQAQTGVEKTIVVNEQNKTITTSFSGGKLKTQDVDTNDLTETGNKESRRDVLQSVWGKTRANLLEQIMDLKDIYFDVVEEFEELFMGLY